MMKLDSPWSGPFNLENTSIITGLPLAGRFRNLFREKRWCYAGIVSPDIFFGAAVVHLGYAASGFCFAFDRETGKMEEFTKVCLPTGRIRYDRHPETGICRYTGRNARIEFSGNLTAYKQIRADLPGLGADIEFSGSGFAPMHFPMDMGGGKTAFTTKAAGPAASGSIRLGSKTIHLDPETSFTLYDWTHGAYHRQTFWNWACGAGRAKDNTDPSAAPMVGFNFSRGVYEGDRLENTLWIDGIPEPVGRMDYAYDAANPMAPWQVSSEDGRIDLKFHPEGIRRADDNFFLLASRFIQPCGRFDGDIRTLSGRHLTLENAGGVVEEHYAKW
ncbi:MAG: DUF2804 domain-containing protein [Desulfobacter sp.]|nr:MAG: DUF2804 domain-containing protein [Desulfobacter sp.]